MMLKSLMKRSLTWGVGVALLMSTQAFAFGEASVIQGTLNKPASLPLIKPSWGNFILHKDSLLKLYNQRSYQAIWVDSNGLPNAMTQTLKSVFATADRHGLNPADYWDSEIELVYQRLQQNQNNWITFELMASEALIRYATHLSAGRFDPEQIDTDIKYKKKISVITRSLQPPSLMDLSLCQMPLKISHPLILVIRI